MRVDLDSATPDRRRRVHVQPEAVGQRGPARHAGELRLAAVGGVGAGVEAGEVAVERGLGGPVAGVVGDHERASIATRHSPSTYGASAASMSSSVRWAETWTSAPRSSRTATPRGCGAPGEVDSDGVHDPHPAAPAPSPWHRPHPCGPRGPVGCRGLAAVASVGRRRVDRRHRDARRTHEARRSAGAGGRRQRRPRRPARRRPARAWRDRRGRRARRRPPAARRRALRHRAGDVRRGRRRLLHRRRRRGRRASSAGSTRSW